MRKFTKPVKYRRWRDAAYVYVKENGPQTARTLAVKVVNAEGRPYRDAPSINGMHVILSRDGRFEKNKVLKARYLGEGKEDCLMWGVK